MSIKTVRKRIALVAVASLGFGLMSAVPASAAVSAITAGTLSTITAPADKSLKVTLTTASSLTPAYTITTRNDVVTMADLQATVTGTYADIAADTFAASLSDADVVVANTVAIALARSMTMPNTTQTGANATAGGTVTGAFGTFTAATNPAAADSTTTTMAASTAGTVYTLYLQPAVAVVTTASNVAMTLTVYKTEAVATAVVLDTATTTYAGRVGQQVSITPTGDVTEYAGAVQKHSLLRVAASITSQPAVSAGGAVVYPKINAVTTLDAALIFATTGSTIGTTAKATSTGTAGDATSVSTINYSGLGGATGSLVPIAGAAGASLGTVTFTPTAAGVYTVAVWNESSTTGIAALSGSESYQTFTINVGSTSAASVTLSAFGATSAASGASGSLVKVTLKDAAGNITIPATGETVTLTPSGSGDIGKVNDVVVASAPGAAYNLSAADFGQTGIAWVNMFNTVAETITVTATISGSSSAAISLTYNTTTTATTVSAYPYSSTATGYETFTPAAGAQDAFIAIGTVTTAFRQPGTYNATTTVYHIYSIVDTSGGITGALGVNGGYDWDQTAGVGSTGVSSSSVTTTTLVQTTPAFTVLNPNGTTTVKTRAIQGGTLTLVPATINATSGSSVTITGTLKDTFGRALASTAVTASVTGRNPTTVPQTALTDSLGNYSFVIADANTTSLLTSDSVTVGSTAYTTTSKVATILYGTANAAAKVVVSSDDYTDGVANNSVAAQLIVASTTYTTGKAGAEAGAKAITAVVTNAAGAILAGVPVKWTVSGTTAAILSTKATTYTDNTGTATTSVYAWATGTYTVTATAGAVSGTATETFAQTTAASARTISATVSGGVVTAMAKDRFGNGVSGVVIVAKINSGSGFFGAGVLSTSATTGLTGTAKFVVAGGSASVTVSNIPFSDPAGTVVGQTGAAAGYDIGGVYATLFGASVAGTATVAEYGVGSTFSAAGVASATVEVTGDTSTADAAQAAADAAAEATDAANAATDAANAAAEAADAATAAAQDASDAVAALSAQVATLISGLKAQLTALTNLVIKIQKKVKA